MSETFDSYSAAVCRKIDTAVKEFIDMAHVESDSDIPANQSWLRLREKRLGIEHYQDEEIAANAEAIALLRGDLIGLGQRWRQRAAGHLEQQVDRAFRGPQPLSAEDATALSILRSTVEELSLASTALQQAAKKLKDAGQGLAANAAIKAHLRAAEVADGLKEGLPT